MKKSKRLKKWVKKGVQIVTLASIAIGAFSTLLHQIASLLNTVKDLVQGS